MGTPVVNDSWGGIISADIDVVVGTPFDLQITPDAGNSITDLDLSGDGFLYVYNPDDILPKLKCRLSGWNGNTNLTLNDVNSDVSLSLLYGWRIDVSFGKYEYDNLVSSISILSDKSWLAKTANYSLAVADLVYHTYATNAINVELPSVSTTEDGIISDIRNGNAATHSVTVQGNIADGDTIEGAATYPLLPTENGKFKYHHADTDWKLI